MVFFRKSPQSAVQARLERLERHWKAPGVAAYDLTEDAPVAPVKPAQKKKEKLSAFETELLKAWAED